MLLELPSTYSNAVIRGALDLYAAALDLDIGRVLFNRSMVWNESVDDAEQDVLCIKGGYSLSKFDHHTLAEVSRIHSHFQLTLSGARADEYATYFDQMSIVCSLLDKLTGSEICINDAELSVLSKSCEMLARHHALQFEYVWCDIGYSHLWHLWKAAGVRECVSSVLSAIALEIGGDSSGPIGQGSPRMGIAAHVAWDLYEYFRHALYKRSGSTDKSIVSAYPPFHWYRDIALPVIRD